VSRQQFVTLLVKATENLLGRSMERNGTDQFVDDNGGTHEENIEKANDSGILEGIPVEGNRFVVSANVTRGEAAQMINNAVTRVLAPARVFVP
jgi:hypothetical protein